MSFREEEVGWFGLDWRWMYKGERGFSLSGVDMFVLSWAS